ncbi:Anion exchange transporter [Fasciola gigantica]|uniref:Anion exchange transporter n=1 Tax=Fasciola gigantica TaxID=46835 RepID=A0A504YV50_FASGI|nr:Anion exchange transporter [Fasciola gigantica]
MDQPTRGQTYSCANSYRFDHLSESPIVPNWDKMHNAIVKSFCSCDLILSRIHSLSDICEKMNYKSDFNQELYAYGLSNTISSFFQAYPSAASLSRSSVQVSAGGKTQVATLFSSILLILVLYFIGPLFYSVPNCCLSAIIVVALKGMFVQAVELKYLCKYSLWDFVSGA